MDLLLSVKLKKKQTIHGDVVRHCLALNTKYKKWKDFIYYLYTTLRTSKKRLR
jgi:hypothetical protein